MFQKPPAHFGRKKYHREEDDQKDRDAKRVLDGVVRVKWDAIKWNTVGVFLFFDIDAVRVIRTDLVQGNDV